MRVNVAYISYIVLNILLHIGSFSIKKQFEVVLWPWERIIVKESYAQWQRWAIHMCRWNEQQSKEQKKEQRNFPCPCLRYLQIPIHLDSITVERAAIQLGVELTKLGDSDDPLEGTNVTLICRQSATAARFFMKFKWSIIENESKKPVPLNETDLPEGLK